jgi:hypothetical protein
VKMDCIELAQDKVHWWASMNSVEIFGSETAGNFLVS